MAKEIQINISVDLTKSYLEFHKNVSVSIDMAGTHISGGAQSIGTTEELVAISTDVATPGIGYFRNLDATNYVELGPVVSGTFVPLIKIMPGAPALFGISSTPLYARAHTAAVVLEFQVIEA